MYPHAQPNNSSTSPRRLHGFVNTDDTNHNLHQAHPPTNPGTFMGGSGYIDMNHFVNDNIWRQISSSQIQTSAGANLPQGLPIQRPFYEANAMWPGSQHCSLEGAQPAQPALQEGFSPSTQHPFTYGKPHFGIEREAVSSVPSPWTSLPSHGHDTVGSVGMPQQRSGAPISSSSAPNAYFERTGSTFANENTSVSGPMSPPTQSQWNPHLVGSRSDLRMDRKASEPAYPYAHGRSSDTSSSTSNSVGRSQNPLRSGRSTSEDLARGLDDTAVSDSENVDELERVPISMMSINELEMQKLLDKRQKRRESHNAVERRRRDTINSQITECAYMGY